MTSLALPDTGSLIIAFAGLALATASYIVMYSADRFRSVRYLTKLLGEQYGFIRMLFSATYEVQHDGSANISFQEEIIATNADLVGIEHYSAIPGEPGNVTGQRSAVTVEQIGENTGIEIKPKLILATAHKLYYQLLFNPALKPGQSLAYSCTARNPINTFCSTIAELKDRNLPFDYVSFKISYPTEKLDVTMVFPEGSAFERIEYDVWMGDARLRLRKEYGRLEKKGALETGRRDGRLFARLIVDYPIIDLKYAIVWVPLDRDAV
jgi:hypothetical protein